MFLAKKWDEIWISIGSLVGGSSLALYNFINHPTGVVPITIENGLDQSLLEHYPTDTVLTRLAKEVKTFLSPLSV